jgi:hypothetical protein
MRDLIWQYPAAFALIVCGSSTLAGLAIVVAVYSINRRFEK